MTSETPQVAGTRRGDGRALPPGAGVVPILKQLGAHKFKVVGTGFFLTRYGVFATAKHVLDDLADYESGTLHPGFILQDEPEGDLIIRRIVGISVSNTADVGLGQADNGVGRSGRLGPANLRGAISLTRPAINEALVSYGYPENAVLDFELKDPPILRGDYIHGKFLSQVAAGSNPFIRHAHYETSLEVRSGASGCPVFNKTGRIVAIACRGWDFRGAEHEGDDLSSVIPVTQLLPLELGCLRIPSDSWEFTQIPANRHGATLTFAELITYGHVDVGAL